MRAGQNPAKFQEKQASNPQRITVAILTYIPHLSGYYAQTLNVLKASLDSLAGSTREPFDLLIFDNASGSEANAFLEDRFDAGQIDYLVRSKKNIGKGKAWDFIFGAAPGEIIAYADSDVYYRPGWLREGLMILETFPRVGMVTCRPMRTYMEGHSATLQWVGDDPDADLDTGNFIDWETFREHDISLGQDEREVRRRYESTEDFRVKYRGLSAHAGAAHWQFLAYRRVLGEHLPLEIDRPLGDDRKLDDALNHAGYLRLMTTKPLVQHLGNTLPESLRADAVGLTSVPVRQATFGRRLLDWSPLRRILLGLYNRIFRWYFYR